MTTRKITRLVVQLTSKRTGAVHKFNGNEWIGAAYFMDMVRNTALDPSKYDVKFKRVEVK